MYLSLLKNKRNTNLAYSEHDDDKLTTASGMPFNQDQIKYLGHAVRRHHLNRIWSLFQEFEWNMELSRFEQSKNEGSYFTLDR